MLLLTLAERATRGASSGDRTLCAEPYLDTARGVQLKPGDLCAMHVCLEALYSFTCDQPCRKSRKLQRIRQA